MQRSVSVEDLRSWLAERVAAHAGVPVEQVSPDVEFSRYGLDSVAAFTVCAEIEDYLDIIVDPTLLWDRPTINALSEHLVGTVLTADG